MWSKIMWSNPQAERSNMYLGILLFSRSVMSNSLQPHGPQPHGPQPQGRTPGFLVLYHLLELAQTHVRWVSDAIQPSHPLSSPSPALNLSQQQGLSNESAHCIRWPKYWSFSISSSNEYSGLISFRIDWFHLLADQGTLKNRHQHHSWKASILQRSAFFRVQLSHPYMTTENGNGFSLNKN